MKRIMRKLIPVLMVLLVICSVVWYLFSYDRTFTRDLLLNQARSCSTNGNSKLASWFYDFAYNFSDQDENVAIELANLFKAEGNYTKAEYTLSNAIADGGTSDLYVALCQTYVEQDKLLDAISMLDNISNPAIKEELDARRPSLPIPDPAPGFYTQYIDVTFPALGTTLYYTTGTEYPSTEDPAYEGGITLDAGETTIRAIAVSEEGLVSSLGVYGYTVGGVIEAVNIDDPAIDRAVRDILQVSEDHQLFTNELWSIKEFTLPADAVGYEDLAFLTYVENLTVQGRNLDSLEFLSGMDKLRSLDLTECRFPAGDLAILAALPELQSLNLTSCGLSTLAGLEEAPMLSVLDLSNNTIRNLSPLSGIQTLRDINLQHNAVTGLEDLSLISGLQKLDVSYNSLTSLSPLTACQQLSWLDASNNTLASLDGLEQLTGLTGLFLSSNSLSDVSILAACTNLTELRIAKNALTDISMLNTLTNLETLDFSNNEVEVLPAWPDGTPLRTIDGSHNQVTSLANLRNMVSLNYVYMDYNQLTSVNELAGCNMLVMVNVYGNEIGSVSALTDQNIIVNYDPT